MILEGVRKKLPTFNSAFFPFLTQCMCVLQHPFIPICTEQMPSGCFWGLNASRKHNLPSPPHYPFTSSSPFHLSFIFPSYSPLFIISIFCQCWHLHLSPPSYFNGLMLNCSSPFLPRCQKPFSLQCSPHGMHLILSMQTWDLNLKSCTEKAGLVFWFWEQLCHFDLVQLPKTMFPDIAISCPTVHKWANPHPLVTWKSYK